LPSTMLALQSILLCRTLPLWRKEIFSLPNNGIKVRRMSPPPPPLPPISNIHKNKLYFDDHIITSVGSFYEEYHSIQTIIASCCCWSSDCERPFLFERFL
jgi:hypothetical protein